MAGGFLERMTADDFMPGSADGFGQRGLHLALGLPADAIGGFAKVAKRLCEGGSQVREGCEAVVYSIGG